MDHVHKEELNLGGTYQPFRSSATAKEGLLRKNQVIQD